VSKETPKGKTGTTISKELGGRDLEMSLVDEQVTGLSVNGKAVSSSELKDYGPEIKQLMDQPKKDAQRVKTERLRSLAYRSKSLEEKRSVLTNFLGYIHPIEVDLTTLSEKLQAYGYYIVEFIRGS
jgi:hypothetical protein